MPNPIKVLIVDDSALVRAMLSGIIQKDSDLCLVGMAKDPFEAREMIKQLNPDVLTLDIEMPKMNGLTFLSNLMRLRPMPVVMISTLTESGAPITLEALELGAVDFLLKPKDQKSETLEEYRDQVLSKIKMAAKANLAQNPRAHKGKSTFIAETPLGKKLRANYLCAIGASTGGTEAIKDVLIQMPKQSPPIVITQHIPAAFSASFAKRLDAGCQIKVFEAEDKQPIRAGCAYLAPGDKHLKVVSSPYGLMCRLDDGVAVNRHKPSVEVLFDSVVEALGSNALGVLLTGMGADGAAALKRMRDKGCSTIAQDEATSIVWGMPGVAVKLGAAEQILALTKVAMAIVNKAYH